MVFNWGDGDDDDDDDTDDNDDDNGDLIRDPMRDDDCDNLYKGDVVMYRWCESVFSEIDDDEDPPVLGMWIDLVMADGRSSILTDDSMMVIIIIGM